MSSKTYWGLNEIELNQFWKSLPNHKDKKNIFLSLEEHYKEPYEYYLEKVKLIEPNFTEKMLINISEDMIDFKDKSDFTEYIDYKEFKRIPTPEELEKKKIMDDLMKQKELLEKLILEKSVIT